MYVETYSKPKLVVEYCEYCNRATLFPFFKHKKNCPAPHFIHYEPKYLSLHCFLFGHKLSHSSICDRCNMDVYYDLAPVSDVGKFLRKWIKRLSFLKHRMYQTCYICNKPEYILGRKVANHDDCIPF